MIKVMKDYYINKHKEDKKLSKRKRELTVQNKCITLDAQTKDQAEKSAGWMPWH